MGPELTEYTERLAEDCLNWGRPTNDSTRLTRKRTRAGYSTPDHGLIDDCFVDLAYVKQNPSFH